MRLAVPSVVCTTDVIITALLYTANEKLSVLTPYAVIC